ncbi:unnamed protein product [Chilo suppressalis]|uniref:Cation-dependent mannose-6-phosphate receptor n=1 Tax=Chilo suppressalis TaxID=168631 RepID=A0ABN8AV70_CHISP|nr:hypothetical protein evm_008387 [Chilo suppressalis]CAH0400010.1 unnamed protein product [Chilo suppressalis]
MFVLNEFLGLSLVCLLFILSSVCSEDVCVKRTPCTCVFPNGTGVDLRPVAGSTFYSAVYYMEKNKNTPLSEYSFFTYYFHPCSDLLTNRTNLPDDTCNMPLSLYRVNSLMTKDNGTKDKYTLKETVCNYLGKSDMMLFKEDGRSLIYENLPSNTTVQLSCAQGGVDQLHVTSIEDPANIQLTFFSSHSCLTQIEEPGRSFGSTLLIIFFSFVVFYLVLGVCTKKFLMGATGLEVIPNLGFWTELPNLVKDGWAFAINGFKLPSRGVGPAAVSDPNSYDSI